MLSYFTVIQNPESEKLFTYECGFEPYEDAHLQIDVEFYLIAILFLIFDLEMIFIYINTLPTKRGFAYKSCSLNIMIRATS